MDSQCSSSQNRTAGCENPDVVAGNGGRTPPKPSGDRNQRLNAAGSSSSGRQGTSSFPPTFTGDEPRPLQTDFFRHCSLFFAHLGEEEESEQWASYLPEYLRPGNIDNYLEENDEPQLYGDNYWWLSEENSAQEQPSFNQSSDHIRYSRVQLLELREKVMAIPENILKVKQDIEAECLAVNQIAKRGGTQDDVSGARREHKSASKKKNEEKNVATVPPQRGEEETHELAKISSNLMKVSLEGGDKEKHEVQNVSVNSTKEAPEKVEIEKHEVANASEDSKQGEPQTEEKEKQEGFVSGSKKEKKKRRVLTDERKEKRKIAKKKKRAEKNRKLGVKRVKIQPLLKPKPVSHCRHYLKGRCHEGEKCKFSHDVEPLTKSMPCCHFARQSCMKGDDCPYDHDLSKYPCNKFVTTGFCPRQGNCLFSHKVTPNQDPAPTTDATKPETKASSSDSIQHHPQKPNFVFGANKRQAENSLAYNASGSVTAENSRGNVSASKGDQPVKAPQGFTFLNTGNCQKDKQPVPASTSADVIVSGKNNNKTAFGAFDGEQKGAASPSNPPALPNPAGVFAFGKNPPQDHNPPASPNSACVFVFEKNPRQEQNLPAGPSSAGVIVSGKNSNKTAFGDNKGAAFPSNPPASSNSAGVFAFGKNPPQDHNPPASPNSAGVFVFGKNPPQDHNPRASPNSAGVPVSGKNPLQDHNLPTLPNCVFVSEKNPPQDHNLSTLPNSAGGIASGKNSNETAFGGATLPSNPPTLPNFAGVILSGKNPPQDHNLPALPNSAGVIVSGKNSNKTAFGGATWPSNPPNFSNSASVILSGKNPPQDHNPPASPNSAGASVFGKNPPRDHNPPALPNSADVIVSGKNSNKTAFGDQKGATLPSNQPTLPNSAGLFVLGKNPPQHHNPPASPNSADVSVFGKNPPQDHNPPASPNSAGVIVSGKTSNKTAFGDKKGAAMPSNPPTFPNPAGIFMLGKNPPPDHNKRHQPSSLPSGSKNKTASGKKAKKSKKVSAAPSNPPTSAFPTRLHGLTNNTSSPSASGAGPANASAGTNTASADAGPKKQLSAVEVWEILYGKGSTQ